jgi:hypothetical protein
MSYLSILAPTEITDAMITSINVPENDYAVYSAATTYPLGQRCISLATHRIYESAAAGNLNHDPTDLNNQFGATKWWIDVSATNARKLFDYEMSSQTVIASPFTVVLRPGPANAIYLGNLDAEHISLTVKDAPGGTVIFSDDRNLENSQPGDWWDYWQMPFKPQRDYLAINLAPYYNCEASLTLTNASAPVKIGMMMTGDLKPLGQTLRGGKVKPKTYSTLKTNEFGDTMIKRRKASKDLAISARLALAEANSVIETLTDYLDVPCLVVGSERSDLAGLRAFGLVSGEVTYDLPNDCLLNMNVQGMK